MSYKESIDVPTWVFIKSFPFEVEEKIIYPKLRYDEILSCKSEKVRQQKYYVWKLLEYAVKKIFKLELKDLKFIKNGSKWQCENFQFSLSHTDNLVAVAISKCPVGIDIEKIDKNKLKKIKPEKIFTSSELSQDLMPSQKIKLWTIKEAGFKMGNNQAFIPNKIDTTEISYCCKKLRFLDNEYYICVSPNEELINWELPNSMRVEE